MPRARTPVRCRKRQPRRLKPTGRGFSESGALLGAAFLYGAATSHAAHRFVECDSGRDTGIGNWTDAGLKRFLVSGVRPNGTRVAPIMPTAVYTVLTARDLDALAAYLRSVPPAPHETPVPY